MKIKGLFYDVNDSGGSNPTFKLPVGGEVVSKQPIEQITPPNPPTPPTPPTPGEDPNPNPNPNPPTPPTPPITDNKFEVGDEIEVDDIKLKIDENGNAIDETGNIKYTKEQLVELNTSDSQPTDDYISIIKQNTNIIPMVDGKPVEYENTTDGFTKYITDVLAIGRETGKTEFESELFNTYPVLQDVIQHLKLTGDIKGFNVIPDWDSVKLSDKDDKQWESVYREAKIKQGLSNEEVDEYVTLLRKEGRLKGAAEASLKYLSENAKLLRTERQQQIEQSEANNRKAVADYVALVQDTVKKGTLKIGEETIQIPDIMRINDGGKIVTKTRDDFNKYLFEERKYIIDGKTRMMTANQYDLFTEQLNRTHNEDIHEALRRFLRYNDSQLIRAKVENELAKKVIKLTTKSRSMTHNQPSATGSSKVVLPVP